MNDKKSGGFTLIELLTVISIIAILASILFPTFSRAREKARQTACSSNQRQIVLGVQMYVSDYDGLMVISDSGLDAVDTPPYWYNLLDSYIKNEQIYLCPSDYEVVTLGKSSYRFAGGAFGQEESAYDKPAEYVLLGECIGNVGALSWTGSPLSSDGFYNGTLGTADARRRRHNEGANYTYLDGHVKWQKIQNAPF